MDTHRVGIVNAISPSQSISVGSRYLLVQHRAGVSGKRVKEDGDEQYRSAPHLSPPDEFIDKVLYRKHVVKSAAGS
jgi:hypothetical protein